MKSSPRPASMSDALTWVTHYCMLRAMFLLMAGLSAWVLGVISWPWVLLTLLPVYKIARGGRISGKKLSLTGKTVIVTGSNSGIGYETAKFAFAHGATVVMACRSAHRMSSAAEKLVSELRLELNGAEQKGYTKEQYVTEHLLQRELDLSDFASIDAFVADICARKDLKLSVLFNNAGIMHTKFALTQQGHEVQIGTNHVGHARLTRGLMDVLDVNNARVVNVASFAQYWVPEATAAVDWTANATAQMTREKYDTGLAYGLSKMANLLHAWSINNEAIKRGSGVRAFAVHPGVVMTNLFSHYPTVALAAITAIGRLLMKSQRQGAQTSLHCAFEAEPVEDVSVCPFYSDCRLAPPSSFASLAGVEKLVDFTETLM
jgi:retinol dehydrogenase-12